MPRFKVKPLPETPPAAVEAKVPGVPGTIKPVSAGTIKRPPAPTERRRPNGNVRDAS